MDAMKGKAETERQARGSIAALLRTRSFAADEQFSLFLDETRNSEAKRKQA
jgi:hypothetical protein